MSTSTPFLSLKWRAVLYFSLMLLGLSAAFTWVSYLNLNALYDQQLAASDHQSKQELQGLLWNSAQRLQQIGELIPALSGMSNALLAGDSERWQALLDQHSPLLHLDMGIEQIAFFASSQSTPMVWGLDPAWAKADFLVPHIAQVFAKERPVSTLHCLARCIQFVMVPVLRGAQTIGVLVLGKSLEEMAVAFNKVTGQDIGLLGRGISPTSQSVLAPGELWVTALTHAEQNYPVLETLMVQQTEAPQDTHIRHADRDYALRFQPLGDNGLIVVISDISVQRKQIRKVIGQNAQIGLIGFALSEALLLLILWRPLSRLRHTADLLPWLARHAFQKVRTEIRVRTPGWFNDEIDVLEQTAVVLSEQLEGLEDQVQEQRAVLAMRMEELSCERERYALAAQGANDGLWDWDLEHKCIYYSARWKAMLGHTEEMIGPQPEEWFERVHPEDIRHLKLKIRTHIEGVSAHFQDEFRMMHRDGTYRWMLYRAIAVRNKQHKAYRMAGSQTDITERKQAQDQLLHDAFHDGLTGLSNRALFMDRLDQALRQTERHTQGYFFAVLVCDLDRFKLVVDSMGHEMGDRVLLATARRLQQCLSQDDTLARLNGDEFAALLTDIQHQDEVETIAKNIRTQLMEPYHFSGQEVFVTLSIGIAIGNKGMYDQPSEIFRDADIALHHAKAAGRDRHVIFDASMHQEAVDTINLQGDLHRAVQRSEFELHYQPIIRLSDESVAGFEALVRWQHPKQGLVGPDRFIPLAEESGLIQPLGLWVFRQACQQIQKWRKQFPAQSLVMNVNLSNRQLLNSSLMADIQQALADFGTDPTSLKLEITESSIVENVEFAVNLFSRLKALGFALAIDDFGTGYSSLSRLHTFPTDTLKIDRTFVQDLSPGNGAIARAVITLAHSLGMDVVAEGVETQEQLEELKQLSCEYAQGYFYAKPLDAATAETWLTANQITPSSTPDPDRL